MKKFLTVFVLLLSLLTIGCAEKPATDDRVTYRQTTSLYGQEGVYRLCIRSGSAEVNPTADGTKGQMENFTIISLRVVGATADNEEYSYRFRIAERDYEGQFVRDRFGSSCTAELDSSIPVDQLTAVTVICKDTETVVPVEDMMEDLVIDGDKALELALKEMKTDLEAEEKEGLTREIHLKFINDGHNPSSKYYWYVAFIRSDAPYWAVLIDPDTGDVVAKRK